MKHRRATSMHESPAFNRRALILGLPASLISVRPRAHTRPKLIGVLNPYSGLATQAGLRVFRRALAELGYVEGRQIVIAERTAEGSIERLEQLAIELVNLAPDIIFVSSTVAAKAVQKATSTVPVVFITVADPVGSGLALSLANPGRNFTGLSNFAQDLDAKRFELLRQMVPAITRLAVLVNPSTSGISNVERRLGPYVEQLGMRSMFFGARSEEELDRAFEAMAEWHAQAVYANPDPFLWIARRQLAGLTLKARLPSMFSSAEYVEAGGLMSYGADQLEPVTRAAAFIDKIFKGTRAADLPIEQPTRVELTINKRTAAQLQLNVPNRLLLQAERIVE